jgi:hypothetical protein
VNVSLIVLRPARVTACFLKTLGRQQEIVMDKKIILYAAMPPPEERTFSYHKNFRGKSCGMSNFEQIATR